MKNRGTAQAEEKLITEKTLPQTAKSPAHISDLTGKRIDDFLLPFYPKPDEPVFIQPFPPKGAPTSPSNNFSISRSDLTNPESMKRLRDLNEKLGIAFFVNAGGTKAAEITRLNAFFVDIDEGEKSEQLSFLETAPLKPSIIVETARGYHGYWLVDGKCSVEEWKDIQLRLIHYFSLKGTIKPDEKIKNPNRAMRLPYLNHVSYSEETEEFSYLSVGVTRFSPKKRFTVEAMCGAFASAPSNLGNKASQTKTRIKNQTITTPSVDYPKKHTSDFATFDELADELRRRMKTHPTYTESAEWGHLKGVCHNGRGNTALSVNLGTGAFFCMKGCASAQILRAFNLPSFASDILIHAPLTDTGNAECFSAVFGDKFRFDHDKKKWLMWDEVYWKQADIGEAQRAVIEVARERRDAARNAGNPQTELMRWAFRSENVSNIRATFEASQINENFATRIDQYDHSLNLAATKNGTVDLELVKFRESKQEDYITKQLGTLYDPEAECPAFEKFIKEVCGEDDEGCNSDLSPPPLETCNSLHHKSPSA